MSWRTVIITRPCKLDFKMGYMVVRSEEIKRVFVDEISLLIIENPAVSISCILMQELVKNKVRVIFCDSKRIPNSELVPYYGSHDDSRKIEAQISWASEIKGLIWTEIITAKLRYQAEYLEELGKVRERDLIRGYIKEVELMDTSNREGHAAKVYFNAIFGMDFSRSNECTINAALNYGYGIFLSAFNREITANGYLTQLGMKHRNMFNHFNLSSDIMEPYRILVDRKVKQMHLDPDEFRAEDKYEIVRMLEDTVKIDSSTQTVLNAIKIYTKSVFDALNDQDVSKIKLYELI